MLASALLACLSPDSWALPQDQPPIVPEIRPGKNGRGRDPWVFRLIFEDRTRMVAVALAQDMWYVFNPETCAPYKVWQGKMDFRGKVWDFSQDNSRAQGTVLAAAVSEIATLGNGDLDDWEASGVTWNNGWKFSGDGATLTSPYIDLAAWQRVFLAFDEQSRKGRISVEVSDDGGRTWNAQKFASATSVTNDTDWQWNFKLIETHSPVTRIRFVQANATHAKSLRNVRLFGDQPAWLDQNGDALKTVWRGYEIKGETQSISLLYDLVLPSGNVVSVRHRPEFDAGWKDPSWSELISIHGLRTGDVVFYSPLEPLGRQRSVFLPDGSRRTDASRWPFAVAKDADVLVRYEGG